jgi:hypothetical protein
MDRFDNRPHRHRHRAVVLVRLGLWPERHHPDEHDDTDDDHRRGAGQSGSDNALASCISAGEQSGSGKPSRQ